MEYANRHWQTRLEHNVTVGTGRAPYGWVKGDADKTWYTINHEEAAVRFSVFHMFVTLDMSVRGIAHKLTEDGILPPAKSRGAKGQKYCLEFSTVHMLLTDPANIGVLQICKSTKALTPKGTETTEAQRQHESPSARRPASHRPARCTASWRKHQAQDQPGATRAISTSNPEDFPAERAHLYCKTCNYTMQGPYQTSKGEYIYTLLCLLSSTGIKYDACPDLTTIRTDKVDQLVWQQPPAGVERLETPSVPPSRAISSSRCNGMLEDTTGKVQVIQLTDEIAYAEAERAKHPEGSYYYRLTSQDIQDKKAQLLKYEAQASESQDIVKLSHIYRSSILGFLESLKRHERQIP